MGGKYRISFLWVISLLLFQNCGSFQSDLPQGDIPPLPETGSISSETSGTPGVPWTSAISGNFDNSETHEVSVNPALDSVTKKDILLPCGITENRMNQIHQLVNVTVGQRLMGSVSNSVNYPSVLYNIQELTAGLLKASENCRDVFIIDSLARLYSVPFDHIKKNSQGHMMWLDEAGHEVLLYSTQFIYAVAKLVNIIAHIDQALWTEPMRQFMFTPRGILKAHLVRWVSRASIGQCFGNDKTFTFLDYIQRKNQRVLPGPNYCNSLWEPEMWAAAAISEYLQATNWVGLSSGDETLLTQYLRASVDLFESRLSTRQACPDGSCLGLLLDVGGWNGHPEYPKNLWPIGGEVWDISHMRRVVQWVDAFYINPTLTGASYSTHEGVIALLSNELAYQVFNRNFNDPQFTNFWNGWAIPYRGNGPFELSSSYYRAGYGFWGQYRQEIRDINRAIIQLIESKATTTFMTVKGVPPDGDYDLVNFYSSLTVPAK